MASNFIGDICVSTGEYKDPQTQEDKKRWHKVGAAFEDENGNISFKLEVLPMPKPTGCWLKLFKKDQNNNQQQHSGQQHSGQQHSGQQHSGQQQQNTNYGQNTGNYQQ